MYLLLDVTYADDLSVSITKDFVRPSQMENMAAPLKTKI